MMPRILSTLILAVMSLSLAGCSKNQGPGLEIHDTKYVGIGADGEKASSGASSEVNTLPCTLDQFTGLMWEVKTDQAGLHDWRNTYTWYNPEESNKPGELDYRGTQNGGDCAGSDCDSWAYVLAVNEAGYCGHHDWRLPVRNELASISDLRKTHTPPTTNMLYFPKMQAAEYWSGNDYHFQYESAWAWNFGYGHDRVDWKKTPKLVRLVRGEALNLTRTED